jgi:hypothetical protein
LSLLDILSINAYVAVQSALSGFLIGVLFQFFYKQTMPLAPPSPAPVPTGAMFAGSPL